MTFKNLYIINKNNTLDIHAMLMMNIEMCIEAMEKGSKKNSF